MRIVIAPQEFKGSLTAARAAEVIAAGVRLTVPDAELDIAPMSDGGAGLVDALLAARGGQRIETAVCDPLMRPVNAAWALLADGTAAIEMAAASGLVLVEPELRDASAATTRGTGELIRAALDRGARRMIVGVGGSATVDGGAGAMQALGARLLDEAGRELSPGGVALARLERIDMAGRDPRLAASRITVASDVTNPLYGPRGAAVVYGPQKGASTEQVLLLDAALARFARVVLRDFGVDLQRIPGSGAAGGLGAGLTVVADAAITQGFDIVADAVDLDRRIAAADLVIAGEGRLDAQTPYGKTAAGVAGIARRHGKRVACVAGSITADADASAVFDAVEEATPPGMPVEDAMQHADVLVCAAASRVVARMR